MLALGLLEQLLGAGERVRRHRRQPLGEAERLVEGAARRRDRGDDAMALQRFGGHRLGQPDELLRQRPRQRAGEQPGGAAVGREADLAVRDDEAGIGAGDDQVAGQGEREAGAGRGALDRGDHRLRIGADRGDEVVQVLDHLVLHRPAGGAPLEQALEVAAGAEMGAGAAQDHGADLVLGFARAERLDAGGDDLGRERVAGRRVADREDERGAAPLAEELSRHRAAPPFATPISGP